MFDTAPSLIPIQSRASLLLTFLQDGRRSSLSIKAETPEIATDTTNKTASLVSTHNSWRMVCDLDRELENSQAESGHRLMSTRLITHLVVKCWTFLLDCHLVNWFLLCVFRSRCEFCEQYPLMLITSYALLQFVTPVTTFHTLVFSFKSLQW